MFFHESCGTDVFEDDGNLHIEHRTVRACFDVGQCQTLSGKEQNKNTTDILTALNVPFIVGRALVEEHEEDGESEDESEDESEQVEASCAVPVLPQTSSPGILARYPVPPRCRHRW